MVIKNLMTVVLCSVSSMIYSQNRPSDQLTQEQIQQDISILSQSISEGVIEAYWYREKAAYQSKFDSLCSLDNGMPYIDFYREVTGIVSSMGCLHSYVQESPLDNYFNHKHLFFPVGVNNTDSSTLVSFSSNNKLPIGSKILEINGRSIEQVREQLFSTYGTDGFIASIPKYGTQNDDFSYFYKHYVDTSENFLVKFKSPTGARDEVQLQGISWDSISGISDFEKVKHKQYPYGFSIEQKTAIINIETSSRGAYNEKKWAKFLTQCFQTIQKEKINYLIIDVRRNSGGWMPHMFHLVEYFSKKSFIPITEAWQKNDSYDFMKYSETPKRDFVSKKNRDYDSLIGVSEYDKWLIGVEYKPMEDYFFKGQVYILTGGNTHSAASRFVSTAREYADPIIVGDSPGGCYIGGSGGNTAAIVLPNSKISINLALTFFTPDWFDYGKKGIALVPDHIIEQEIGKDAAMEFTLNQIKQLQSK